ncbi:serine hydrolase [Bifidobacterium platyrrhinorum]|uniref:serine hydrolase n=1 Tax=Bifidobacterium platyrrhinorum TaxID=2661628 RepID=UPI0013D7016B|nr:serine hydrolase [Bifidobacterium platyrrhinorum]
MWVREATSAVDDAVEASQGRPTLVRKAVGKPRALTRAERALDGLAGLDEGAEISTSGFTLADDDRAALESELAKFTAEGHSASVALVDMSDYRALSVNGGDARYSASAIKGPYILSLAATGAIDLDAVARQSDTDPTGVGADGNPVSSGDGDASGATDDGAEEASIADDIAKTGTGAGVHQLIEQAVTISDNDSFAALHRTYGAGAFAQWSARGKVGVDVTSGAYLTMPATDLARMWVMGYGYLFDGDVLAVNGSKPAASDDSRQWLAGEYTNTLNSSIHMALAGDGGYTVYTKAGWIDGDGGYYALNDAGIVSTGSGDYVLAVMTDAVDEYELVSGLVSVLDGIHSRDMSS